VQWSGSEAEAGKHTPDTLPVTAKLANRRRSMKHDTKRACSENERRNCPGAVLNGRASACSMLRCKESRAAW
jgi:hypothetical protein